MYSFVPFHGTPLRKICEDMGLINPEDITLALTDKPSIQMEQYPEDQIEGLKKCFVLYVKMDKKHWKDIKRAEADTPEGNRIFEELKQECLENNMPRVKEIGDDEQPNTADLEYGLEVSDSGELDDR